MALTRERIDALLVDLSRMGAAGRAETEDPREFRRRFYPVSEHARAFDPDVVLVVGDRGTGKTELFRAVVELNLLSVIARKAPRVRIAPSRSEFVRGFPLGSDGPSSHGLRKFFGQGSVDRRAAADLWLAYLVRVLEQRLDSDAKLPLRALLELRPAKTTEIAKELSAVSEHAVDALDRLDRRLAEEDKRLFVGYDELDTLGGSDFATIREGARGLVSLWADYSRRWSRIRAKIFLRSDLFRRSTEIFGADVSKLAGNRAELSWSDKNLYAMLVKRMANSSPELLDYCRGARVQFERDADLEMVPVVSSAGDVKPLIDRMIGPFMGANQNKGLSFNWLLDHVRDGREVAVPRALLVLIERAAEREMHVRRARGSRLLHPSSLRRALDDVSGDHVEQATTHEWPWLAGVSERLKGLEVTRTTDRRELERRLAVNFEGPWGLLAAQPELEVRPPAQDSSQLVDYLLEVGALKIRKHLGKERIDVPDLYVSGLKLKRRGGVTRQ